MITSNLTELALLTIVEFAIIIIISQILIKCAESIGSIIIFAIYLLAKFIEFVKYIWRKKC